jgi:transposase-like protein
MNGNGVETEVTPKAKRRTFSAQYKRDILAQADKCTKDGDIGALLRREGLYSSHLTEWRRAREAGELDQAPKKRGRKAKPVDERDRMLAEQAREIARLQKRAERAELLVEIQKKVSMILGIELPKTDEER